MSVIVGRTVISNEERKTRSFFTQRVEALRRCEETMVTGGCAGGPHAVDIETLDRMDLETCKQILARLAKGLAHPARIEIIRMLGNKSSDREFICSDIVRALPLAQASVSQHLKILKETGWIYGEIDGPRVVCRLVENILAYYQQLMKKVTHEHNT